MNKKFFVVIMIILLSLPSWGKDEKTKTDIPIYLNTHMSSTDKNDQYLRYANQKLRNRGFRIVENISKEKTPYTVQIYMNNFEPDKRDKDGWCKIGYVLFIDGNPKRQCYSFSRNFAGKLDSNKMDEALEWLNDILVGIMKERQKQKKGKL